MAAIPATEFKAQRLIHVARTRALRPEASRAEGNRAALLHVPSIGIRWVRTEMDWSAATMQPLGAADSDVTLSALIDDELPEAEAERVLLDLSTDAGLARRFAEMSQATAVLRASYKDALDVFGSAVAVYARAVDEARRLVDPGGGPPASGPADDARAPARLREIDFAVASLTSEQRHMLCLVVLEGLSYVEVAEALRIPRRTIIERLAEARAALVAGLGEAALATMHSPSTLRH